MLKKNLHLAKDFEELNGMLGVQEIVKNKSVTQ